MNVGSILNDDSSSSDHNDRNDSKAPEKSDIQSNQRHSIVNLLNAPMPNRNINKTIHKPQDVIKDTFNSETFTKLLKRNSIANITNEKDVDISTGQDKSINFNLEGGIKKPNVCSVNNQNLKLTPMKKIDMAIKQEENNNNNNNNSNDKNLNNDLAIKGNSNYINEEDELVKLNKLKSSNKPKRHINPPIWAQEWISTNTQNKNLELFNGTIQSALSNNRVFNPSSTVSVDLECSITGVIPPSSVTRTIAEWIYANFKEIPDDNRQFVELELKFGTIIDKRHAHRININVLTECIFTDTTSIYFDMGVHEVGWNIMCQFLDSLERSYQEELRKNSNSNKPKRKFTILESDITDTFYQITNRNEQPKSIRVTKDNLLSPPRYIAINKQRISDLYIHNPSSMYDLRLSLSFEHPIPESSIDTIVKKNKPVLIRHKKRNSWTHRPTVTKFDMTRVLIPKELKNKAGKTIIEQDRTFEVELEIDTLELFNGFDKFKNGVDAIRFEELVEIFINNARCLNNRVTKLANK